MKVPGPRREICNEHDPPEETEPLTAFLFRHFNSLSLSLAWRAHVRLLRSAKKITPFGGGGDGGSRSQTLQESIS